MSGPLPASAHGASTLTLTLTSDPVALSLYYEWSLEEVKAVLREVFCLESRTQVGLQRRVARCRTSCTRSLGTPRPLIVCVSPLTRVSRPRLLVSAQIRLLNPDGGVVRDLWSSKRLTVEVLQDSGTAECVPLPQVR